MSEDLESEVASSPVPDEEPAEEVIGGFIYPNIFDINYKNVVSSAVHSNIVKSMKYGDSFGIMMYLHDLKKKQRAAEDILRRKLMLEENKIEGKNSQALAHKINHKYYESSQQT
jgi:hypothetical protein